MNAAKSDRLTASMLTLRQALAGGAQGPAWTDAVHAALGAVADAIQGKVQTTEQSLADVGDINPDFQNAPATERKIEASRAELIRLGEQVHQLRADLRQTGDAPPLRIWAQKIADAIEKAQHAQDAFVLDTVNSNPGSGE